MSEAVRREVVASRLALMRELVNAMRHAAAMGFPAWTRDTIVRLAVERAVAQWVDMAGDICVHLCKAAGGHSGTSLYDAVECALAAGIIPDALALMLRRAVGMRNILVHEYQKVDLGIVHAVISDGVADMEHFHAIVETWLGDTQTSPST